MGERGARGAIAMNYEVVIGKETFKVELRRAPDGKAWECRVNGSPVELDARASEPGVLSLLVGGRSYEIRNDAGAGEIAVGPRRYAVEVRDPRSLKSRKAAGAGDDGPKKITAPMPGKVVRILVAEGAAVEAGEGVIVIEAMKMQNELKSPKKGVVKKMSAVEGATVNAGDALAVVE